MIVRLTFTRNRRHATIRGGSGALGRRVRGHVDNSGSSGPGSHGPHHHAPRTGGIDCGEVDRGDRGNTRLDRNGVLGRRHECAGALFSAICQEHARLSPRGQAFAMLIPMFGGMIPFYTAMTGTFFLPLTVPYVGGALYRQASRRSGMASVAGGIALGCVLFFGGQFELLPPVLSHPQWRPFWVLAFTGIVFVVWSVFENRVSRNRGEGLTEEHQLASILNASQLGKPATPEENQRACPVAADLAVGRTKERGRRHDRNPKRYAMVRPSDDVRSAGGSRPGRPYDMAMVK